MILYASGNILESSADILVNPVNCRGKMGAGLALQFREKFPTMYRDYADLCKNRILSIGTLHWWWYRDGERIRWIVNFPTKDNWKQPSKIQYIRYGLERFVRDVGVMTENNFQSAAWPKIGCGLGGLNWNEVEPLMLEYLEPLQICSTLYVEG